MKDKKAILRENAILYKKVSKKLKSQLLDELSQILHMNRKYIAFVQRNMATAVYPRPGVKVVGDPSAKAVHRRCKECLCRGIDDFIFSLLKASCGVYKEELGQA